ncbi:lysine exporter family protein [Rhodobacteraceae bacterium HTCC2083]|uniref:lysine exporter family protein n=1 Tax=Planktotalea sp. TaxID=2029877 RepID=UPI000183ADEC|nr:lysine exporter family protein [Rhodobacteraceae bacterium HTCC2083]
MGLPQLFLGVPIAYDVIRRLGVAYLLYLAWGALSGGRQAFSAQTGTISCGDV